MGLPLVLTIGTLRSGVGTAPYCQRGAIGGGIVDMPQSPSPTHLPPSPADPLAPYDLSSLCDGRRTDFPLGMLVETAKVMLNGVDLQRDLDFLLAHKDGQSKVELRRAPPAGGSPVVLRV